MKTTFLKTINFITMLVIKYLIFHDLVLHVIVNVATWRIRMILCLHFARDRNA